MNEYVSYAAFGISAVLFAFTVFDRAYGAGSRRARVESKMKEHVDEKIEELRKDVYLKHDNSQGNIGQAIQAMKDGLHRQELAALEARALAAETYMRRDSFYAAMGKVETSLGNALDKIERRLEGMEKRMENRAAS